MKFYKYSLIAALALSGALCACDDDIDYTPGAPVSGDEVFLPITQDTDLAIVLDATSIDVEVSRLIYDNEVTVPVSYTVTDEEGVDASDIFTVPAEVHFAAGEKTVQLPVAIEFSKVVPDVKYSLTITLSGDNTTPYGASSREYTLCYSPWTEWEVYGSEDAVYTMSVYTSTVEDVPVLYRESMIDPNRVEYAVCDLFYVSENKEDGPYINFVYSMNKTNTIEVDGVECPIVTMNPLQLGENGAGTGNYLVLYDIRTWLIEIMNIPEASVDLVMEKNNFSQSYFNPKTGTFAIDLILIGTKLEPGYQYASGFDYVQLPGFKNYEIAFDYTGNYVDQFAEIEYAVVNAYKSNDVNSYIYSIFNGELEGDDLAAAIETIKNNDELEAVTAATTNLAFALTEEGAYTIVAVGLDGNREEVCNTAYTFDFKSVRGGEVEKWNSLGFCEYTDGIINSYINVSYITYDVEIQEKEDAPGYYRLVDPYKDMAEIYSKYATYAKGKHYLYIDAQNPEQVIIPESMLGIDFFGNGEIGAVSMAAVYLEGGISPEQIAARGLFGSLNDDMITFPTGSLYGFYGEKAFYANVDPSNPGFDEDYEGEFDPTWGEGTFCVDLSGITSAANVKAKAPAVDKYDLSTPVMFSTTIKEFKSNFKIRKSSKTLKSIDSKTLNEYRLANPKSISL